MHDLAAAYVLDALDADERAAFERHLRSCVECQAEVAQLSPAAEALAVDVEPVQPPDALRERILADARRGGHVVPFRRRAPVVLGAVASVAAVAAAVWAVSLSHSLDRERSARASEQAALAIAGNPQATRAALTRGALYVAPSGRAALVTDLPSPPSGKVYEVWVVDGGAPQPVGLYEGRTAVLDGRVAASSKVAVTVEPAGGSEAPTGPTVTRSS